MSLDKLPPPPSEEPQPQLAEIIPLEAPAGYSPPRLSIAMLLGWTAAIAANFGIMRWLGVLHEYLSEARVVLIYIEYTCLGTAVAALLLMGYERIRHRYFPGEPGEWILVAMGGSHFMYIFWTFVRLRFDLDADPHGSYVASLCGMLLYSMPYIAAWRKGGGGVNWFVVFTALLFFAAVWVVHCLCNVFFEDFPEIAWRGIELCSTLRPPICSASVGNGLLAG